MTAGGSPMPAGSGNGAPTSLNAVGRTDLWRACRREIEDAYPWLVGENVFDGIEALMIVLDVDEDARYIGGQTWFLRTPEDYYPVITIYFTYADGAIVLQAAHAHEF